ncbi:DNA internalization-related competence protein ComEC/Rec2 [Oleiagrimonas sp. MCCC 1A03011]|uniref:DNA internalization-related competence protein ComEC/Rec2 n=1 Tax=Oleiagrimonas sp. MCCC 1A03011 TaxID=1926883 RepID=UPI000DC540D2|nr:DNA internalization-related competence protein ComEC/Rec2 [Oleiagrimonas sp. MCCC 1A03011]RAP58008.1 DNA internalization-related competence protein ComEC/Rec2 [Oleiagrimonas sp. MCCC 1A03011]
MHVLRDILKPCAKALSAMPFALSLLLGVTAVQCLDVLPSLDALLPLALVTALTAWRCPRARSLCWMVLAFVYCVVRAGAVMQQRLPRRLERQDFDVVGVVEGLPQVRSDADRFVLRVEQARFDGKPFPLHGRLRLAWYRAPKAAARPCLRWRLRVRLRRPRGFMDPGAFDGERQALLERIAAVGYVRKQGPNRSAGRRAFCIDGVRARMARAINHALGSGKGARLLRALGVGDKRGLREGDWRIARADGVSHLLAISGFHIGVAALLGALLIQGIWRLWPSLGKRWPRPAAAALAAVLVASVYACLAGLGLPTLRALLMIAVLATARVSRRSVHPLQALSLALSAVLLFDPLSVLSAGFWLSFAAVALLLAVLDRRRVRGLRGWLRGTGQAQLLMTVALLPVTAWFFGQGAPWGLLANLFAIPVVSMAVVPLTLAGMALRPISATAAGVLWRIAGWIMRKTWAVLAVMAKWPGAHWYLPAVSGLALLLACIGALWLFAPRGIPGRWLGLLLWFPLLWPRLPLPALGAFRATVLDVGQGLAVIVRTRHHLLVYDTGARYPSGFNFGDAAVLPAIRASGAGPADRIVISHGDNDHAGGARAVAKAFPDARRLSGEPKRMPVPMPPCHAGQHWSWDGVRMRVLSPPAHLRPLLHGNDLSCVLLIRGRGGRLLLTGDITRRMEPGVARQVGSGPPLILVVPHHGSNTSSSAAFIDALRPRLAVVSAGWLNRFGHPRPKVLARYRRAGVPVLDTATAGAVSICFPVAAAPRVVARWRQNHPAYWRE